jgi:CRP-like cAMP-binding protein
VNSFLSNVESGRTVASYRKNQNIFSQAERADSVFYIQEGKVKVYVISEQGKEAVVAPWEGRFPRRGLPDRLASAVGDGRGDDGMRHHAARKGGG